MTRISFLHITLACTIGLIYGKSSTAQALRSPESIVLDESHERYLISNTVDGRIRSMDRSGQLADFGDMAMGSHGLLIMDGRLLACYRTELRCYDIETEKLLYRYEIPNARFLNGICKDSENRVYLSDFSARSIYSLTVDDHSGQPIDLELWKRLESIPNGLAYDELRDEILVLTWGSKGVIHCIDRSTASIKHSVDSGHGNLESIAIDERGDAYVSAWSPAAILKYEQGVRSTPSVWNTTELSRPTGLTFSPDGELVYLSSDEDEVYGLKSGEAEDELVALDAFPNPVSVNSLISYTVQETGYVNISVYDSRGALVQTLLTEEKSPGKYKFIYERGNRSSGLYFINVQSAGSSEAIPITLVD